MIAEQESETATPASRSVEVCDPLPAHGEAHDQRGGAERSGEAREAHQRQAEELPPLEAQGEHRAEGRAARHPQGVGLGEGVAEEGLEARGRRRRAPRRRAARAGSRGRRICQKIDAAVGSPRRISASETDWLPTSGRQDQRREPRGGAAQDQARAVAAAWRPRAPGAQLQHGDRPLAAADDLEAGAEEAVEHLRPEDLGRRAGGEDLAAGEREEPVAEQRGEVEVVGGEDDGAVGLGLEAEQQAGEVALVAGVEVEVGSSSTSSSAPAPGRRR